MVSGESCYSCSDSEHTPYIILQCMLWTLTLPVLTLRVALLPSTGGLLPVKVSTPPIFAEEEEDPSLSAARKGKRRAE